MVNDGYPLVNFNSWTPENHQLLEETNLKITPMTTRVYVNLLEDNSG